MTSSSSTWRDPILQCFMPIMASEPVLTIVSDQDSLFTDDRLLIELQTNGYEVIDYADPVSFRYLFEREYRDRTFDDHPASLVVCIRQPGRALSDLPFDIYSYARQSGRILSFSLAMLFPGLSSQALSSLEKTDLDALYEAQNVYPPGQLGMSATKEYVLRHVFDIAPELIKRDVDLLRILLQRHQARRSCPRMLDEHLVALLRKSSQWDEWPLEQLLENRAAFIGFLNERWPIFVDNAMDQAFQNETPCVRERPALSYRGPELLPFDHSDVQAYVRNLFTDGSLSPVRIDDPLPIDLPWLPMGVAKTHGVDEPGRLEALLSLLENERIDHDINSKSWIRLAYLWAEAVATIHYLETADGSPECTRLHNVKNRMNTAFRNWLSNRYFPLASLSRLDEPAMLHHVPHIMLHRLRSAEETGRSSRLVLVVLDGMALDQWIILRSSLTSDTMLEVNEMAAFAWIPTITSISRRSLYSGEVPLPGLHDSFSIPSEESIWKRFWMERGGLSRNSISFVIQGETGEGAFLEKLKVLAESPEIRVIGTVISSVDRILHGTVGGRGSFHASLRHWVRQNSLHSMLDPLFDNGFDVLITSDHGNTEAAGVGRPNAGSEAREKGSRVIFFRDESSRDQTLSMYPNAMKWREMNGYPLLAGDGEAFSTQGSTLVTHGGASIEEVIVPFIKVCRR